MVDEKMFTEMLKRQRELNRKFDRVGQIVTAMLFVAMVVILILWLIFGW